MPNLRKADRRCASFMKSQAFTILLLILLLCSCQEKPVRHNKITKISFATGGCFGICPFLAIEIDSTLEYKFYGGKHADLQGYYKGKISQTLWDTINMRFEPLQNRSLDTNLTSVDDMSFQNIIHFGQYVKDIQRQEMELPMDVRNSFRWLMNSYKKVKLKKVADKFPLETVIQNGPPAVPPPKLNDN